MSDTALRSSLIRLAAKHPKGSDERKQILNVLAGQGVEASMMKPQLLMEAVYQVRDAKALASSGQKAEAVNKGVESMITIATALGRPPGRSGMLLRRIIDLAHQIQAENGVLPEGMEAEAEALAL